MLHHWLHKAPAAPRHCSLNPFPPPTLVTTDAPRLYLPFMSHEPLIGSEINWWVLASTAKNIVQQNRLRVGQMRKNKDCFTNLGFGCVCWEVGCTGPDVNYFSLWVCIKTVWKPLVSGDAHAQSLEEAQEGKGSCLRFGPPHLNNIRKHKAGSPFTGIAETELPRISRGGGC